MNGAVDNPPAAYWISVGRPGLLTRRDTFQLGEPIRAFVSLTEFVAVTGEPSLNLTIGTRTRPASYVRNYAVPDGSAYLTFVHHVEAEDLDTDGLSVAADALATHMDFYPRPSVGDVYLRGEEIEAYVSFDKALEVIGTPLLAIDIGDQTRHMTYDGLSPSGVALRFLYTVQAMDQDLDGIEIGSSALTLNGGAIRDAEGNDANLSLADARHTSWVQNKADGTRQATGTAPE